VRGKAGRGLAKECDEATKADDASFDQVKEKEDRDEVVSRAVMVTVRMLKSNEMFRSR